MKKYEKAEEKRKREAEEKRRYLEGIKRFQKVGHSVGGRKRTGAAGS